MNYPDQTALLARAARRAGEHPAYLGWVFGRYAETERVNEQDFCALLAISPLEFHRLCLCLRPRKECFADDLKQIATQFELDPGELARIARHVEATEAMKSDLGEGVMREAGLMLAARARSQGKKPQRKNNRHGKRKKP